MNTPLDTLVKTEGNREAFDKVIAITQVHEKPEKLFLVGPEQSGKTALLRARQLDKDLLSTKRVLYRPCAELAEAMRANVYDGFFEELGTHEVLFLDDFDGFFEDLELGPRICQLLMRERDRLKLDTVISARKPLAEYDLSAFEGALDGFEEVTVEALEGEALVEYVSVLQEEFSEEGKSPVLAEEAIAYIAHDLDANPEMMKKAVHFLMTQYEGEPGEVLSRDFVVQALA